MANIEDWYGRNGISWGKSYEISWAGNVNEANKWGIIYPFNFEGGVFTADSTLIKTDTTQYRTDQTQF